jgi:hypothetical protein
MLRRVELGRTAVSEERIASIIMVTRIGELQATLAATSKQKHAAVLREATRRNIPEDGILHSYLPENRKSYIYKNDYLRSKCIYQESYIKAFKILIKPIVC